MPLSIHDEIGDLSGGQTHFWPGDRTEAIADALTVGEPSGLFELDRSIEELQELSSEIRAAEIARNICSGRYLEFGTDAIGLCGIRGRTIPSYIKEAGGEKSLVSFIGTNHVLVGLAQELAWLSFAMQAGATSGDLADWGVRPITIQQLLWWERRDGETLLKQHIRAERNGLALPWLAAAIRDSYGNLLRFVEKGAFSSEALEEQASELEQVRELMAFFEVKWNNESSAEKPEPLVTLTDDEVRDWAAAFAGRVSFIAPDARGRWGSLPKVSLEKGELRGQALVIAKYFKHIGLKPSELLTLPSNFFGRVGDVNA